MRQPRTIRGFVLLAGLLLAAAAGVAVVRARAAAAASQVMPGKGVWLAGHTDFVGYYRGYVAGRWVKVYCVSPAKRAPDRLTLHLTRRLPATDVATTREIAETLAAHGDARSAVQSEAVSQAVNEELGNHAAVARRARALPEAVRELAARYVAEARSRRAPYTLELRLPTSALPGQSGTGTVRLRSGRSGVAGTVTLGHTPNVAVPAQLRVDASGRAAFTYRTVAGGAVHVAATARTAPGAVLASRPDPATQLMVTWAAPDVARAFASYQGRGPSFAHSYTCSAQCDGQPAVALTACAPADDYASRISYWIDGVPHSLDFPAARQRACATWQARIRDGVTVSATWQYRAPRGWTPPLPAAAGSFVVDCPAAPPVAVLLSYDCTQATLSATLGTAAGGVVTPLRNTTRHRMVLVLDGAVSGRYDVDPGATAQLQAFRIPCGTHATVTVAGGVQRTDGSYNYGSAAQVVTP
jgi:hypothetical protein